MDFVDNYDGGLAHNLVHEQSDWETIHDVESTDETPDTFLDDELSIDDGIIEKFDIEKIVKGDVGIEASRKEVFEAMRIRSTLTATATATAADIDFPHEVSDNQKAYLISGDFSDETPHTHQQFPHTRRKGNKQDRSEISVKGATIEVAKHDREQVLSELRTELRKFTADRGSFPFSSIQGGLPRGALVHVLGTKGGGKTELTLKFLAENPEIKVAWIEDKLTAYPVSFEQMGAGLERMLFVRAAGKPRSPRNEFNMNDSKSSSHSKSSADAFWAFSQIVNSQYFDVVVLASENLRMNEKDLRRWQLMAEQTKSCCLLISENESLTAGRDWAVALKLEVERVNLDGPPQLHVVKSKSMQASG